MKRPAGSVLDSCAHAGRKLYIPRAVRKVDGELTSGPSEVLEQWHLALKWVAETAECF